MQNIATAITINWQMLLVALVSTFASCWLIVSTKRWHGGISLDSSSGVQKFHTTPTPRVGGIGLCVGFLFAFGYLTLEVDRGEVYLLLRLLLIAGLPAFLAGIAEDFTKAVSVRTRLLCTALSGLMAAVLTGYWVQGVGIWGLDTLLAFAPLGILFTAFAVAGIANSVNIIDGFNGLASGVVILMLLTLAFIAYRVGDTTILNLSLLGAAVSLGFLLVNFPRGHLFLGDAGAYSLGFYVAVLAVSLSMRNVGQVSPWAMLLVCGYPLIETLFSIYRRMSRKRKHHPGSPDASHLHSLVYRRVVSRRLIPHAPAWQRNAYTSPILWVYSTIPMLGAIFWPQSLVMVVLWLFVSFAVYQRFYRKMLMLGVFFARRPEQMV